MGMAPRPRTCPSCKQEKHRVILCSSCYGKERDELDQLREKSMTDASIQWFARGGGIARTGPFNSQVEAWEAMRYTDELRQDTGYDHPPDTSVWPEKTSGKEAKQDG